MSAAIRIEISDEPTRETVHRFRNFAEDVSRLLRDICTVDLKEIDKAATSVTVRDIRKRELGTVTQLIKKQLKLHFFSDSATLVRLDQ